MAKMARPEVGLFTVIVGAFLVAACQTIPASGGFSAEQQRALEGAGFSYIDGNYELGIDDRVLFEFSRSDLRADVSATLQRLSAVLLGVGINGAMVEGHTDSEGPEAYNLALSQHRAESVRLALAANGMTREAIFAQGRGEAEPVSTNATPQGRQENRRVVIVITPANASGL